MTINLRDLSNKIEEFEEVYTGETVIRLVPKAVLVKRKPKTFGEKWHALLGQTYYKEVEKFIEETVIVSVEKDTPMYNALKAAKYAEKPDTTTVAWLLSEKRANSSIWQALYDALQ